MKYSKADRDEAAAELRRYLPPGSTCYTVLRHVSASGMTRWIDLYAHTETGLQYLTGYAAIVLGESRPHMHSKHDGIKVGGCGMDMGFHLVYTLAWHLYHDSDDWIAYLHANPRRPWESTDAGYAINHKWI